jgi:hypothetical protein
MTPPLAVLRLNGVPVAEYADGSDLAPDLAPRPYFHPVRTLGGVVVTDVLPADHLWHLGLGVAIPDVDGWNLWGGNTFVAGQGYVLRDDHGRIEHAGFADVDEGGFSERLRWITGDGDTLLTEDRQVRAQLAGCGWELQLTTTLTNATERPLRLGSPATNGRPGAGYGGLFWRLPHAEAKPHVFTEAAEGEEAVHDSVAPWLAWIAPDRDFTIVLTGTDEATRADPWFVRVEEYPGLGSQLAAHDPLTLPPAGTITRGLRALIADGPPTAAEVRSWAEASP